MPYQLEFPSAESERVEKATIFFQGDFGFGFHRVPCRWIQWREGPYAQYRNAVHVRFVPKGKRSVRQLVHHGINQPLVILSGWDVPDLTKPDFEFVKDDTKVRVMQSRHTAFSSEWEDEFDAGLRRWAGRGGRVLLDARGPTT
jgi:hypothetical protein